LRSDILWISPSQTAEFDRLQGQFRAAGYHLHFVTPGRVIETLSQLRPGGAVLDVTLPDMNAMQVVVRIRQASDTIAIIAISDGDPTMRRVILSAGADQVLNRPWEFSALDKWLSERAKLDALPRGIGFTLGLNEEGIMGTIGLLGHDLKSPISIIISTLEVLVSLSDDNPAMESTIKFVRGALSAAYRQLNMISDMLDLARLELNSLELNRQPIDMVVLLREILETEKYNLTTKKLKLEVDLPETLLVNADGELLRRVFSALIDNTVKFTVKDDVLRVAARQENNHVLVTFSDNGRAVTPGFEQRVMERSPQWEWRQDGTRTSVAMGLPFAYAVLRAHGGGIAVKSDPATKFTTFTLTLDAFNPEEVLKDG
jgi:signal transduction histidine kinase